MCKATKVQLCQVHPRAVKEGDVCRVLAAVFAIGLSLHNGQRHRAIRSVLLSERDAGRVEKFVERMPLRIEFRDNVVLRL